MTAATPTAAPAQPARDASTRYTYARLGVVTARVAAAVRGRRAADPMPDDPFRGLYLSDGARRRGCSSRGPRTRRRTTRAGPRGSHAQLPSPPAGPRRRGWSSLAGRCGLDPAAVDILLLALAPDLDRRLEQLYGYLHNDVSRRRASVGLALDLAGLDRRDPAARALLLPEAPLVACGLVVVEEPDRPFLSRALRVPDRVTQHLLGDDRPDAAVRRLLVDVPDLPRPAPVPAPTAEAIAPGAGAAGPPPGLPARAPRPGRGLDGRAGRAGRGHRRGRRWSSTWTGCRPARTPRPRCARSRWRPGCAASGWSPGRWRR